MATNAVLFGELLRHFREGALLTQEALASAIPCDRSLVARVEAGTRVPQEAFAKKCDEVLGSGGVLVRLWGRVDWYAKVEHPDWVQRWMDMEAKAVSLSTYHVMVVPGLLQTPDYVRALMSRRASGDLLDQRVEARLSRQPRYLSEGGPLLVVVMDESCLRHSVGSPAVMRDQYAHLLRVGRLPNIRIQVAPSNRFDIQRPTRSTTLVVMPDGERWFYSESPGHGHFDNDPAVYIAQSQTYDVLRADALSARESAALIGQLMEESGDDEPAPTEHSNVDQEQLQRRARRRLPRIRPRVHLRHPRPRQQEP
ncbi:Scr1 family TA system antitoxin-like transcriptional regulator [Streptomyces sp. NPDC020951]|uniref:helix-turn-helix domain-containing protein n=1 Tax=Streptomyces sp. NPDC020951 TaxID=3365104 RepID=UPI0037B29E69